MHDDINEVGADLVEFSRDAEFTAKRGLVEELFPFIWVASRRMSMRAITRRLQAEHNIKLSVESVSRCMRNPAKYWEAMIENIEPAVRTFAEAFDAFPPQFLADRDLFEHLAAKPPILRDEEPGDLEKSFGNVEAATRQIRREWFDYPEEARKECMPYVRAAFAPKDDEEDAE